uniref:Uncharacterized protein n=1 Tax=Cacopsylla melanoneura TaxID=428564 RepID=A0A8D9F007_9HEMI
MSCSLHFIVTSCLIWMTTSVNIHHMTPGQEDHTPVYHKTLTDPSSNYKPRVQIKAILFKSPARKSDRKDTGAKVSAGMMTDVQKKLIIIIKFTNHGKVFKTKQNQIKQMYPLKSIRNVNWDPWEEVINKNNKDYQGCSTGKSRLCKPIFTSFHLLYLLYSN